MQYIGDRSVPLTTSPHQRSLSPKLIGPSIATIPFCRSQCLATSKSISAATWSLIQSKNPIPPTGPSSPLFLYFLLIKAAIRPINFPSLSFSTHLIASPNRKVLFFFVSNTSFTSFSRGMIYAGLSLLIDTLTRRKSLACGLVVTSISCIQFQEWAKVARLA